MLVNIQSSNLLPKSISPTDQVTYKSSFSHSKHAFKMWFQSLRQEHRLQVHKYEVYQKNFRTNGDKKLAYGVHCLYNTCTVLLG